jgi:hypothetical protein
VVSSWLDEIAIPQGMATATFWRKLAIKDLAEIKSAELFILDTTVMDARGGREVELGVALGAFQGKQIWIVGPTINVFHTLADRQFNDWREVLAALKPRAASRLPGRTRKVGNRTVGTS